jgi:hypothetical protein
LCVLTSIRLQGVPLPWLFLHPLPDLVSLALHNILLCSWSSFSSFVGLLQVSPALRHLSFGGISFLNVPASPVHYSFPSINTLLLDFWLDFVGRLSLLLATLLCLQFPHLRQLDLGLRGLAPLRDFLSPLPSLLPSLMFGSRVACPQTCHVHCMLDSKVWCPLIYKEATPTQ